MNNNERREILYKEIDLIQSCITRMAQNSFILKGWMISLIAVILALLPEKIDIRPLCSVGTVIVFCFWVIDAFFLKTEKLYRMKYDWIIHNRMSCDDYQFDLNPYNSNMWLDINPKDAKQMRSNFSGTIKMMFSLTMVLIYGPPLILFLIPNLFDVIKP